MKRKSLNYSQFMSERMVYESSFLERHKKAFSVVSVFCLGLVILLSVAALCVCASGCATSRTRGNAGDIRLTDSYIAGRLESAVSDFDGGIGRAIRESRGVADEVDRLEFLFNSYEQHALRLRGEVDSLRRQIEKPSQSNLGGGNSITD